MVTYENIEKANRKLTPLSIKQRNNETGEETITKYAGVNQRIRAFRMCFPTGSIETEIIGLSNGVVTIKATISYVENGAKVVLATGHAREVEGANIVNTTSFIENCETSAVGRALGMCGFGIDGSLAAAEEAVTAIIQQSKQTTPKRGKNAKKGQRNANTGHCLKCENCGTDLLEREAEESKQKYGKSLCVECQEGVTGEDAENDTI